MPISPPCTGLHGLTPYEPHRRRGPAALSRRRHADGQLALDVTGHMLDVPPDGTAPQPFRVRALLAAILEAWDGRRKPAQLEPLLRKDVYRSVVLNARLGGAPLRLRTVHCCQPADGVLEACATVHGGDRTLALTARLECTASGWQCIWFELLGRERPGPRIPEQRIPLPRPRPVRGTLERGR